LNFKLLTLFKRTPKTRFLFFLLSDVFLISASIYASFWLRFDFTLPDQYRPNIPYYIIIAILILLPIFYYKRLYHFTWIYVSINNLINIFKAVTYGFLLLTVLFFIGRDQKSALSSGLPRSIILIDYFLVFILIAGLRFSKRIYTELFKKPPRQNNKPKILIIGAGDAAEQLVRSIKQSTDYPFDIAGILDDSDIKQNTSIHNINVLSKIVDLPQIKAQKNIHGIIIAIPSADSLKIKNIVDLAQSCNINYIKILPSLTEVMSRSVSIKDIRDIDVEDLLGRQKINISFTKISKLICAQTVLITGAAGSIGFELVKQVSKLAPKKIIALDMDETGIFNVNNFLANSTSGINYQTIIANILHKNKIDSIFKEHRPDIVFHAAAYKHVKLMEQEPDQAILTNVLGTWNMAESASCHKVKKFVLISTDKAVNPTSVMGMTKRIAEMLVMYYNFIAVRFGNVLGSRGSVVPLFKEQILSGGPVTVTHPKMTRYFMVPSEAILLVLEAASFGRGGEIFVLDMGQPVKILDLAKTMIKLSGLEPNRDMPIVFTKPAPGEKLFEEILTDKENMDVTHHKKIFIAKNNASVNKTKFFRRINELIALAKGGKIMEIKKELKLCVRN
jgi:FlaA1/EpsC-like NDP-sugar epimerase